MFLYGYIEEEYKTQQYKSMFVHKKHGASVPCSSLSDHNRNKRKILRYKVAF